MCMIVASEALLATVNAIVKYVHNWPTQNMMMIRSPVDFLLSMAMCAWFRYDIPSPRLSAFLLMRGVCYIAFIGFFWASLKSCLPFGDVVVTVVTFAPAFLVLLGVLLLGETIPRAWPVQFAFCTLGALIINRPLAPDATCPASNSLLPMAAAFAGSLMNLASRKLKDVPAPVVCMYNDVVAVLFALVSSSLGILGADSAPEASLLPQRMDQNVVLLVVAGVIGWMGLMLNVKGYGAVSVCAVAAIASYVAVPLGYAIQVLLFDQPIHILSSIGAALIVCTNISAVVSRHYEAKASAGEEIVVASKTPLLSSEPNSEIDAATQGVYCLSP